MVITFFFFFNFLKASVNYAIIVFKEFKANYLRNVAQSKCYVTQ